MNTNKIFKTKFGYTMAELLIVIGLIGFIAALVFPTLNSATPRKYEALHKKGDYALEHAVADVVNNEEYYERIDNIDNENNTVTYIHGLQSTFPVIVEGETIGDDDITTDAAKQKFCRLFAKRFNMMSGSQLNCSENAGFTIEGKVPTFTSADGIQWVVPVSDFKQNEIIMYKSSFDDDNSAPQCAFVSEDKYSKIIPEGKDYAFIKNKREECENPDIFIYVITPSGKLYKEEATSDEVRRH